MPDAFAHSPNNLPIRQYNGGASHCILVNARGPKGRTPQRIQGAGGKNAE
jgi:hypothetical protein